MSNEFELKRLTADAIPAALKKAEHYRALNDPAQAESICRDILDVAPDHQDALRLMLLSLTDQFGKRKTRVREAHDCASALTGEYPRAYYTGIVLERQARALLTRGVVDVYEGLREAMKFYEAAEKLRPAGTDDPILRWNSCLRTIRERSLQPAPPDAPLPLE